MGPAGRPALEESEILHAGIFSLAGIAAVVSGNPSEGDYRKIVLILIQNEKPARVEEYKVHIPSMTKKIPAPIRI